MLDVSIQIGFTPDTLKTLDNLAEALRAFAGQPDSRPKTESSIKDESKPTQTKGTLTQATTPPIDYTKTRNEVVAIIRANVRSKYRNSIKELLMKFGVDKVSGLKDEQLEPFATELKALVAA